MSKKEEADEVLERGARIIASLSSDGISLREIIATVGGIVFAAAMMMGDHEGIADAMVGLAESVREAGHFANSEDGKTNVH